MVVSQFMIMHTNSGEMKGGQWPSMESSYMLASREWHERVIAKRGTRDGAGVVIMTSHDFNCSIECECCIHLPSYFVQSRLQLLGRPHNPLQSCPILIVAKCECLDIACSISTPHWKILKSFWPLPTDGLNLISICAAYLDQHHLAVCICLKRRKSKTRNRASACSHAIVQVIVVSPGNGHERW